MDKPYGPIDPNSQHQLWSKWTFTINEGNRLPPVSEVIDNFRRWTTLGFHSMGRVKATRTMNPVTANTVMTLQLEIEGLPAHDNGYVQSVAKQFQTNFVEKGYGPLVSSSVTAKVLSGDTQDGTKLKQLVVMSTIIR